MVTAAQELKRYIRFSEEDAHRLRALHADAAPHFARIAQAFYERIREHDGAHAVLVDDAQVERLQRSLVEWLERLLGGTYDEAYFQRTERIGLAHVRVGLPPRYVPVAMSLLRQELLDLADVTQQAHAPATRGAICRILDIELAVMMEAGWHDLEQRLERMARLPALPAAGVAPPADRIHERAVEVAGVAIVGLDAERRIVLFNAEASRLTGHAKDQVLGRSFEEVLLLPDDAAGRAALGRASPESSTVHEADLPTRAGGTRPVRWLMGRLPEVEGDGELVHVLMGRDIGEERALQRRARYQERLAAVGTLAAGLAHEIRNPLNGALLHLSVLDRALHVPAPDIAEASQATAIARDELQRLSRLVTDFLEFARPRPLVLAEVNMQELCRAVTPEVTRSNVAVELDMPATDVTVEGDRARLGQALTNLVENAVEAASAGGGHVRIRLRREPNHARLEVEDDGTGILGDAAQLFDAFYTTKASGTGLGLTIAHRAISDHHGTMQVTSKPGSTTFRVTLPLRQ